MITKAQRRLHLELVLASARLRERSMDAAYARRATGDLPSGPNRMPKHHALRKSLITETPIGDRLYHEVLERTRTYPNITLDYGQTS